MTKKQRLHMIRLLAQTVHEEGSLTRELSADDLDERRRCGERAGAEWVSYHRGLTR